MKQLGNAFSSAMEAGGSGTAKNVAPYVLKNETGLAMVLDLERSHFKVHIVNFFYGHKHDFTPLKSIMNISLGV